MAVMAFNAIRKISDEKNSRVLDANFGVGAINEHSSFMVWLKKIGAKEFRFTKFKISKVPVTPLIKIADIKVKQNQ